MTNPTISLVEDCFLYSLYINLILFETSCAAIWFCEKNKNRTFQFLSKFWRIGFLVQVFFFNVIKKKKISSPYKEN